MVTICLLMEKNSINSKPNTNTNVNFLTHFFLRSISNKFGAIDSKEVSLKENVYDFSADYNAIDKCDILNIHKYLMVKSNI